MAGVRLFFSLLEAFIPAGMRGKGDEIWHPPALFSIGFVRKTKDTHFPGYLEVSGTIMFIQIEQITKITVVMV